MNTVGMSADGQPDRRRDVLRVLKAAPGPMSINAIAEVLDVHPNTARLHLDTLVSDGRVEHVEPDVNRPGRPALMFRAIAQMDRGGPRRYRLLAEILAAGLAAGDAPGAKAHAAGRAWGTQLKGSVPQGGRTGVNESVEQLVGVLDELGFAPERRGEWKIGLRHCPFLELAEARAEIVCPVHLGLMQGVVESPAGLVAVDRLDAFVEPDLCLAHLTPQADSR